MIHSFCGKQLLLGGSEAILSGMVDRIHSNDPWSRRYSWHLQSSAVDVFRWAATPNRVDDLKTLSWSIPSCKIVKAGVAVHHVVHLQPTAYKIQTDTANVTRNTYRVHPLGPSQLRSSQSCAPPSPSLPPLRRSCPRSLQLKQGVRYYAPRSQVRDISVAHFHWAHHRCRMSSRMLGSR